MYPPKRCLFISFNISFYRIKKQLFFNAVNEKSHNTTALAEVKNLDVARLFIEKGADVNIKNFWKKTPLYRAVEEGNVNKANLLLDNGGDVDDVDGALVSLLMKAVCLNYNEMAYMLLEKGADVNAKDSYNRRALSFVSDVDVSKEIIARGALVNYKDVWKNTPLINAVEGNRIEIVKLFIEKGANVDAQDYQGRTALMHAVNKHYKEITEILVKSGADLNIHDDYEKSAILMADEDMRNVMFTALKEKQKKEFKPMFRVCEK